MKMSRRHLAVTHFILLVFVVWSVLPVFWTLVTSFKPEEQDLLDRDQDHRRPDAPELHQTS